MQLKSEQNSPNEHCFEDVFEEIVFVLRIDRNAVYVAPLREDIVSVVASLFDCLLSFRSRPSDNVRPRIEYNLR